MAASRTFSGESSASILFTSSLAAITSVQPAETWVEMQGVHCAALPFFSTFLFPLQYDLQFGNLETRLGLVVYLQFPELCVKES